MSIERDVKASQSEIRAISTLIGEAMSQFAKLFQNEIDLAKAEVGEKLQKIGGALGLIVGGAVLVVQDLLGQLALHGSNGRGLPDRRGIGDPDLAGHAATPRHRHDRDARRGLCHPRRVQRRRGRGDPHPDRTLRHLVVSR